MKDAVYVSINGLLVGFFKIKYVPVQSVQNALFALLRTKIAPIFAVRDFNITPLMLGQKFKMSTDGFDSRPTASAMPCRQRNRPTIRRPPASWRATGTARS